MNKIINSDALEALRTLPDSCCRTCITSPPYYGLRDYGADGQVGLEDTPELYIENLVKIFREVRRALKDDGTLWVNIGDSYAASGKGRNRDGVFNEKAENNRRERTKTQRPDRDPVAAGLRTPFRRLVSPFGHYLAEAQRHAGKRKGQADTGARVHFSAE